MFKEEINMNKSLGYSQEDATSLAESLVARPGFSEHETGLALDINLDAEVIFNESLCLEEYLKRY